MDKVFADPQVQHLEMGTPVHSPLFGDTRFVASPLNVSGASRNIRSNTPEPGQHTDEVLRAAGYSAEEIGKLRAAGVI